MNREFEALLHVQSDLYGRISRAYENLKKIGLTKVILGIVEAHLQALDANWSKFESQNERLFAVREAIADHEYVRLDVPSLRKKSICSKGACSST